MISHGASWGGTRTGYTCHGVSTSTGLQKLSFSAGSPHFCKTDNRESPTLAIWPLQRSDSPRAAEDSSVKAAPATIQNLRFMYEESLTVQIGMARPQLSYGSAANARLCILRRAGKARPDRPSVRLEHARLVGIEHGHRRLRLGQHINHARPSPKHGADHLLVEVNRHHHAAERYAVVIGGGGRQALFTLLTGRPGPHSVDRDGSVVVDPHEGFAAQVVARLEAAQGYLERALRTGEEAELASAALAVELTRLTDDTTGLAQQQAQWLEARAERKVAVLELEAAAADADQAASEAEQALEEAENELHAMRTRLDDLTEEAHRIDLEMTEATARRRGIVERVEAEWRKPIDTLLAEAPMLDLDIDTLENEAARIVSSLETIGPVNALAVEEHAEESKRLDFLVAQRDDLVAARQSLQQAIREIDGTARAMFLETFTAIRTSFLHVFQTLFGGGECDLRLANPDDPLESEIDIHAAPRGKRTQRIHLLSTGERTLVAVSLLFSIYLTKPSPFCLMDEVDAPLDDANVGRFTRLLDEFKQSTQFLVITHNPRTMQSAEAVYGVTMQDPGVSTIVGVRLAERQAV